MVSFLGSGILAQNGILDTVLFSCVCYCVPPPSPTACDNVIFLNDSKLHIKIYFKLSSILKLLLIGRNEARTYITYYI